MVHFYYTNSPPEHRDHRGRGMENLKIQKSGRTRVKVSSKYDRTQTIALANS